MNEYWSYFRAAFWLLFAAVTFALMIDGITAIPAAGTGWCHGNGVTFVDVYNDHADISAPDRARRIALMGSEAGCIVPLDDAGDAALGGWHHDNVPIDISGGQLVDDGWLLEGYQWQPPLQIANLMGGTLVGALGTAIPIIAIVAFLGLATKELIGDRRKEAAA